LKSIDRYGFDVTVEDVRSVFSYTLDAAATAGCKPETLVRIRTLVAGEVLGDRFVTKVLGPILGF
jgi:hypothetical protein